MSEFLASVERRAFKQAVFAVKQDESALDIVQDAMMKLAEKYATKPAEELPMLFQRILQNTIRDWYRRTGADFDRMCELFGSSRAAMGRRLHRAIPPGLLS